ncbi:MAG: hypothetical protein ABW003_27525 [Microvirga sp.]
MKFVSQSNLVLNAGKLIANALNGVQVLAGLQYWHNKFGGVPRKTHETEEKALIAGAA